MTLPFLPLAFLGHLELGGHLLAIGFGGFQLFENPSPFNASRVLLTLDLLSRLASGLPLTLLGGLFGSFEFLLEARNLLPALAELHMEVVVLRHQEVSTRRAS